MVVSRDWEAERTGKMLCEDANLQLVSSGDLMQNIVSVVNNTALETEKFLRY